MNERQVYFLKQKLIGLGMILGSIAFAWLVKDEAIVLPIFMVPIGLFLLFTKEMYWTNDYYYEVEEDEEL